MVELELTEYVKIGNSYILRESLPDKHPESIESKFNEIKNE